LVVKRVTSGKGKNGRTRLLCAANGGYVELNQWGWEGKIGDRTTNDGRPENSRIAFWA